MTDESKRYRLSISRKAYGGKVFVNLSAAIDDPSDPEERNRVITDLKSPGMLSVSEALEDVIGILVEEEVARIKLARPGGDRGIAYAREQLPAEVLAPPEPPKPSTIEQRNRIRSIIAAEDKTEDHPARRNFLKAVMAREKVTQLETLSFDGAVKVLSEIDEEAGTDPKGFTKGTELPQAEDDLPILGPEDLAAEYPEVTE